MTRKRYVKLLMACGYPRRDCEEGAREARIFRTSYREDLECRAFGLRVTANFCSVEWESQFRRRAADILHRALYGEVAHE